MPETKHPLKVFLCHAHDDKLKTRELYRYLRKRGIQPWLDSEDLVGGQDWRVEIPKVIKASDAIIICLSKNSINKEGFVQAEITFALEKALEIPQGRIFIIPARFEDCEVPANLERFHWLDLFEEDGFPKLMKSLRTRAGQLERTTVQVPKPDESSPNLNSASEEKVESKVTEKDAHGKAEREAAEKAAREKEEEESDEKARLESEEIARQKESKENTEREAAVKSAREKIEKDYQLKREKIIKDAKRQKFLINLRYKLTSIRLYALPILLGVGAIALLIFVFYYIPPNTPVISSTPTSSLTLTLQPSLTSTEPFVSTGISTPSLTPTKNVTPATTPLSTEITDAKGASMVLVQAGEFIMGNNDGGKSDERPVHTVYLDAFRIDQTEVTNKMFAEFINSTHYITDSEKAGSAYALEEGTTFQLVVGANWNHPRGDNSSVSGIEDHPVINVSWNDANAYCSWVNGRLPTEAEWEKAASWNNLTNKKYLYPWGNDFGKPFLNFCDVNCPFSWADININDGYANTAPVGNYTTGASPYGALDMAGNVWEWVADWYGESYYRSSPSNNPTGPDSGQFRVFRGGAWNSINRDISTTYRLWANPTDSYISVGFRCVLNAKP